MTARLSNNPFPAYTYVPGRTPHPVRDPDGHSYQKPDPHVDEFDVEKWSACSAYLFGIDLFNAGFFWESHEQWEAVWHAVGRRGKVANLLKGLIKLSAAGVKSLEGQPNGVHRHSRRAAELFQELGQEDIELCGFQLAELQQFAQSLATEDQANSVDFELRPCVNG